MAGKGYRVADFWSVASAYNDLSNQTLPGKGKARGRSLLFQNAMQQGQRQRFHGHGAMDLRIKDMVRRLAADRSKGFVSGSATSRVTSAQGTGTPLHIQAALAQAKGWRPSLRGYLRGITLEPWLGMDAVWRAIRAPGRMENLRCHPIRGMCDQEHLTE